MDIDRLLNRALKKKLPVSKKSLFHNSDLFSKNSQIYLNAANIKGLHPSVIKQINNDAEKYRKHSLPSISVAGSRDKQTDNLLKDKIFVSFWNHSDDVDTLSSNIGHEELHNELRKISPKASRELDNITPHTYNLGGKVLNPHSGGLPIGYKKAKELNEQFEKGKYDKIKKLEEIYSDTESENSKKPWHTKILPQKQQDYIMGKYLDKTVSNVKIRDNKIHLDYDGRKIINKFKAVPFREDVASWAHKKDDDTLYYSKQIKPERVPGVLVHEAVEQYVSEDKGLSYNRAHEVALVAEEDYVKHHLKQHWGGYQNSVLNIKGDK